MRNVLQSACPPARPHNPTRIFLIFFFLPLGLATPVDCLPSSSLPSAHTSRARTSTHLHASSSPLSTPPNQVQGFHCAAQFLFQRPSPAQPLTRASTTAEITTIPTADVDQQLHSNAAGERGADVGASPTRFRLALNHGSSLNSLCLATLSEASSSFFFFVFDIFLFPSRCYDHRDLRATRHHDDLAPLPLLQTDTPCRVWDRLALMPTG